MRSYITREYTRHCLSESYCCQDTLLVYICVLLEI